MQKILILLISFTLSYTGIAQLSESNVKQLRTELTNHVNQLRESLGVPPLGSDIILKKAAQMHSVYMAKTNTLSHKQRKGTYSTPAKRVRKSGSKDFEIVGENILYSTQQDFPLNKKEVSALAKEMFDSWKNSPGHYANMIDAEYTLGDFGFKTEQKRKVVFATQVFGRKGTRIEGQLSSNGFGLRPSNEDCDRFYKGKQNIIANLGNSLVIEGDKVMLYYHDKALFKQLFPGTKDGIAVDIISRNQVTCGKPNHLDMSQVYDGILLKPKYRNELLNSNIAESHYRLIAPVGNIPADLMNDDIAASVILIKNGKVCQYLIPTNVPGETYTLRKITPVIDSPKDIDLLNKGVISTQELTYNFNTGIVTPLQYPKAAKKGKGIHSIKIRSYSSVEGDSLGNIRLHHKRGERIKQNLIQQLSCSPQKITVSAHENWDKMHFQFGYLFADSLLDSTNSAIKHMIAAGDTTLPWDSLLFEQRVSKAYINYLGSFDGLPLSKRIHLNLKTAILNDNIALANKALFEMYQHPENAGDLLHDGFLFDVMLEEPRLVQNASAVLSLIYSEDLFKTTEFISSWVRKSNQLSDDALFNLLNLYTLTGIQLLNEWDTPAKRLSNVIHPRKVRGLIKKDLDTELTLNLHLTFLHYFGQVNDNKGIAESFDFITDYFKNNTLDDVQTLRLGLFFNDWSMYRLTNKLLLEQRTKTPLSKENAFLLAHTISIFPDNLDNDTIVQLHKDAAKLDTKRWCEWIQSEFQLLRNHLIKRHYCEVCHQ